MIIPRGETYRPRERYTHRLKTILEDYPDTLQIFYEILQNSDDAQSTEQIFILDHNTYPSKSLLESKLGRFQGPALLSQNDTIFEEKDFTSLRNLANSEKQGQHDKIGEKGIGFNSIYHLCDSCSFITRDKFTILDPHEWCYEGGMRYNFVNDNLAQIYEDQFSPFKKSEIPCNEPFLGTIFRYPLRTSQDSEISEISTKSYKPDDVLELFKKFFENKNDNCLLFLKHIKYIKFYELKNKLELLYEISIKNAEDVREKRQIIAKEIISKIKNFKTKKLNQNATNSPYYQAYQASFSRDEKGVITEDSWLIMNMLGDLHDMSNRFPEFSDNFKTVPHVGLAAKLNSDQNIDEFPGKIFNFLPLPIKTPFRVFIHGQFAVINNRGTLCSNDNNDSTENSSANFKAKWNKYLFEEVLSHAWVKFLKSYITIKNVPQSVSQDDYYEFWPIPIKTKIFTSSFFRDLLRNVIHKLDANDEVFYGSREMLSISKGYFKDESSEPDGSDIQSILDKIGFRVIYAPNEIVEIIKELKFKKEIRFSSPICVSKFLHKYKGKLQDKLTNEEILKLFNYISLLIDEDDENYRMLKGLEMIPLANGKFNELNELRNDSYLFPDDKNENALREILNEYSGQLIAKDIPPNLSNCLIKLGKKRIFNIKMLNEQIIADLVKNSLSYRYSNNIEIEMKKPLEWIIQLWKYLCDSDTNLALFEDIHIIPTNNNTLRKLKVKSFLNGSKSQICPILKKLGIVFINVKFENGLTSWKRWVLIIYLSLIMILSSLNPNGTCNLDSSEADLFIKYLYSLHDTYPYSKDPTCIKVIKRLPIYKEIGRNEMIDLELYEEHLYLLPQEYENCYDQIIESSETHRFLDATSTATRYLLEDVIKIRHLKLKEYWDDCVIPYLKSQPNIDIVIVEKLFEQLPSLPSSDHSLKDKLRDIDFMPGGTIQMAQGYLDLDTIKCKPADLFDPTNQEIAQLFFDDEKVFPVGKFSNACNQHYHILKELGIKTSLTQMDIVNRIETYVKLREGNNIDLDDLHNKSLNLFRYIDKYWNSFEVMNNNTEVLSTVKSLQWIPTVNKTGNKVFSCLFENGCRDKKDKNLVSLVVPFLDYQVENLTLRNFLGWDVYPPAELVLEQMHQCYIMSKSDLNFKNQSQICEAVYKHISEVLSCNDEQYKSELNRGLKNENWIFCGGNFYAAKNVFFELSENFGRDIVQLPDDYRNRFNKVFKYMGVHKRIEINDLIRIVEEIDREANHNSLTKEQLSKVIKLLKHFADEYTNPKKKGQICDLKDLLIPSVDSTLLKHEEVYFDDRPELNKIEKKNYRLSHQEITLELAESLGIQMLSTIFLKCSETEFETSEQIRIKNITGCSLDTLFKEFLKNADDAGTRRFSIYLDERILDKNPEKPTILSKEMHNCQGPNVWIYYDKKFNDFSDHKNNIGRAGYLTDILSFVSGENVTFLDFHDPHAMFLPLQGYPPKRPRKIKFNFLENNFLAKFEDQCKPYLDIEDCDFNKEFNGTLFKLPLRNAESQNSTKSQEILDHFRSKKNHQELLFLRNIELYDVYHIDKNGDKQLIWEMKIQNLKDNYRDIRRKIEYTPQVFQLNTRIYDTKKKTFEIWLVCTGGNSEKNMDNNLVNFSKNEGLKAYGGVAAILSRSDNEDDLLKLIDPPILDGKEYVHVSSERSVNLGVHINGDFYQSINKKDKKDISQSKNNDYIYGKWKRHILLEVLPPLHVKLLNEIAKKDLERFKNSKTALETFFPHTTKNFLLLGNVKEIEDELIDSYRTKVLQGLGDCEIFWTEADDGKFVSLKNAYFSEEKDHIIANILSSHGIPTVKMDIDKLSYLKDKIKGKKSKYRPMKISKILQEREYNNILSSIEQGQNDFISIIKLLKFILQEKNDNLFLKLNGLRFVPLKNGTLGTFGKRDYYIAEKDCQELFPKSGPSHFIDDSDDELIEIFKNEHLSNLRIKRLNTQGVLDLLDEELQNALDLPDEELSNKQEMEWNPSSESIPNRQWLDNVFEIMKLGAGSETLRLPNCPLIPVIRPSHKLVKINSTNSLLINPNDNDPTAFIVEVLTKLGIYFTDIKFPNRCLKRSVQAFNYSNVFKSIKQASQDISIGTFFSDAKLDDADYEKLREYIKSFINVNVKGHSETKTQSKSSNYEKNLNIIRELPIWPIRPPIKHHRFISANDKGILPPHNLPCPSQDSDIFDVQDEYYDVLILLDIEKKIEVYDFVRKYYPHESGEPPTQQDVEFLKEILSLKDKRIESYLASREAIPNRSLKSFVKASTLYDAEVGLFNQIFDDDKLLPLELQDSSVCRSALSEMGLKRDLNGSVYLECAHEIQKKINGQKKGYLKNLLNRFNNDEIRSLSINLISCLSKNYNSFSENERKQLYEIDFVPSKKDLQSPYNKTAVSTSEYESFNSLCFAKYRDICWTQAKFIYSDIELPFDLRPGLKMVINHWIKLSTEVFPFETSGWKDDRIHEIMKKIYQVVDDNLNLLDEYKIREFKLKDIKLFLNGDNPFDPNCWIPGKKLVFGLQNNINDRFDVNDRLLPFKRLLIALGAKEVDNSVKMDEIPINYSQKDHLIKYLIECLQNQNSYYDIIFRIEDHNIRANRCVLSNFAKYFDWHFSEEPIDDITIDGVKHETYEVLLRWLYGMSYEDAVKNVFYESFPDSGQQYLEFMLELLKVSHKFSPLNNIIQNNIMLKNIINISNVKKIRKFSHDYNANQLNKCCEEYIRKNKNIIDAEGSYD
ncbi:22149_t:CDS:10 [Dentiscutata erythropus]|uniref:22149_t:CDS:1 n=1 Tax=Dentiscutata erythropus TaxID=1348616 RepID=A0A9N9C7U6_9GLOM|nr:22149_t:CDS:10 [Dentiscutata erythropus]